VHVPHVEVAHARMLLNKQRQCGKTCKRSRHV
jgi:hypothetical protein